MKRVPPLLAVLSLFLTAATSRAEEPQLRELLRDGLYAEEVTRDPDAAAKQYQQVLARYAEQRTFAAAALFRLAEVRRKQDRKEDAVKLYQQLLVEFPGAEAETKLARENLAALGGKMPEQGAAPVDEEAKELARLKVAATSSPDALLDPEALEKASLQGWTKVVNYLLAAGSHRYEGDALQKAAQTGNLEIIKLLLADGGLVPETVATESIMEAIENKRYTALDFMLKGGLKPGLANYGDGPRTVLAQTILRYAAYPAAEILLKNGADIDEMVVQQVLPNDFKPGGTALALAVFHGKFEAAKWLLGKGAKPDLPEPTYGLTPLHNAVLGNYPGTLEMMEKLLRAGADPNHVSSDKEPGGSENFTRINATPLESAIASRTMSLEKTKLLLKHGANPNRKDSRVASMLGIAIPGEDHANAAELVETLAAAGFSMSDPALLKAAAGAKNQKLIGMLLKHGANPNVIGGQYPLLRGAAITGNVELVKMLLDAGADLNFQDIGKTIIRDAAVYGSQDQVVECLKLLVGAGAKSPDENWLKSGFTDVRPLAVRRYLTEQFIIPNHVGGPDITLAADAGGSINSLKMATRQDGIDLPALATLLWANQARIRLAEPDSEVGDYRWSIRRKEADGKIGILKFDFYGSAPLPQLQWGDLVQFELINLEGARNINFRDGFTANMTWALRKRISFPVSVEIEGKTREVILRGDRLVFDPTKDEVPLCDAQQLIQWLWQPSGYATSYPSTILVTRKGWPELRLAYGSQEAKKFSPQAGDRLMLELPDATREKLAKLRGFTITLQGAGWPYRRDFGSYSDGKVVPITVPTLIQAIVETQVPDSNGWKEWKDRTTLDSKDLTQSGPWIFYNFTLFPHPDLAHIRIRRLVEDGGEKIIDVDLAKAIATATTPEAARATDVILQAGDIVEVPLKKDGLALPWKGFTSGEERFFANALGGKVQITDDKSNVTFTEISYRAPRFIETEAGLLPVPAASGVPSVRSGWITGMNDGFIYRKDGASNVFIDPGFLRDGDEYRSGRQVVQPPQAPQPGPPLQSGQPARQPRPRVMPPPVPNNR